MTFIESLRAHRDSGRALLATNFYNAETLLAVLRAAKETGAQIILQTSPATLEYLGVRLGAGAGAAGAAGRGAGAPRKGPAHGSAGRPRRRRGNPWVSGAPRRWRARPLRNRASPPGC